jgi:homoserine dehydrogenase
MKREKIRVGLLGVGNVGRGVLQILDQNKALIAERTGKSLVVTHAVVRDVEKAQSFLPSDIVVTADAFSVLRSPDVDVVVEAMGGEYPAYDYICEALRQGKPVVTANKEVLSKHKETFFALAKAQHTNIYFEATVGGGIPLIRTMKVGLAANRIQAFYGILNGTTNFILTKLEEGGASFEDVLKEAQRLGFAEADPSMDISGLDSAYKLTILGAVAFKADIQLEDVYYEGIVPLDALDVAYAKELGYAIKLLGIGREISPGKMTFKVHPTMIPVLHPLANVRHEFNAVFIIGNAVGESILSGRGAGSSPTGSAIVSDLIDIAFDDQPLGNKRNLEVLNADISVVPFVETTSQFYLRLYAVDTHGVLARIAGILADHRIGISKIMQKDIVNQEAEIVLVTHVAVEKDMTAAIAALQGARVVRDVAAKIRVGLDEG